jgi:hypothetical protein
MQIDDLKKIKGLAVDIVADQQELKAEMAKFTRRETASCSAKK